MADVVNSILYYCRKARRLPPRVLVRKGTRRLGIGITAKARKLQAVLFPTYISDRQLLGALDQRFESINAFLSHKTTRQQPHFFIDAQGRKEVVELISRRYPATIGQTVERADKICDHIFNLLGSGEVQLGEKIDWHADFKTGWRWEPNKYYRDIQFMDLDQPYDVKVPWGLSRCQHFVTLGKAYWYTGDEKYARDFIAQVSDWIEANPPQFGVNWRCTMDVAIRAVNWIWGHYFFKDSPSLTDDFRLKFFKSLLAHGRHIINNPSTGSGHSLEWSEVAGNHYLSDLAGLIYLGVMLPEFKEAERWLELGLRELFSEMRKQVYADGVDYEASISYHRLVAELCLSPILLCRLNHIPVPEDVMDKLERMLEFVMYYTKPDGTIPIMGDADNGRLHRLGTWDDAQREFFDHRYLLGMGAVLFDREDFAQAAGECCEEAVWLLGGGGIEVQSSKFKPPTSQSFPHGGLFIMRHDDLYLIISAMLNGKDGHGSHTHNDKLSFELYAHDKSFIVDPGNYVYTADYRWRNLFRSTAYHNTVVVDGEEQNRFDERNLFWIEHDAIPQVNHWVVEEEYDLFDGKHTGYERLIEPVTHRRQIYLNKLGGFWIIRDLLTGIGEHVFELYFHFAPLEVTFDEKMPLAVRTRCSRGTDLAVIPLRTEGVSVDIKRGWVSYSYGTRAEAPIVRYTKTAEVPTEFITVLFPVRQPTSVEEIRKIVTPMLNSISG